MKRFIAMALTAIMSISAMGMSAMASTADLADIEQKALEFASRYPYKDGDLENSFSYTASYTSAIEKRENGVEYECPAIYNDIHAQYFNSFDLKQGEMLLYINGTESQYSNKCILVNSITLVPVMIYTEMGIQMDTEDEYYVTRLTSDDTVLEIIPYLIGMRKNQASGFWVPLPACARYIDGELYVPVRAVAEELNIEVDWDGSNNAVILTNP